MASTEGEENSLAKEDNSPTKEDNSPTKEDNSEHLDQGGVLITEVPEDDVTRSEKTSDTRSEGGVTLHSHVIETPIPEESEEELAREGLNSSRLSRKSDRSQYSNDNSHPHTTTTPSRLLPHDEDGEEGDLLEEMEELVEEAYEDGSYPDSMSMDNVSDSYSYEEPVELKDEDFDTDLEMDDDKWLNPEKYDHDTTGLTKYLNACQENDVTPVRYFIKHMMDDAMNLGHHGLGPAEMKALSVPLESNTTIEKLDLEGNWIEEEGIHHLCRVLKENVYIVQLNIGENRLGDSGVSCVLALLLENRTIESLDLTGNNLTDRTAEHLCDVLRRNSTLRHLKLRHNELGDTGAQWVKEALMENESLESLDISWNHFQTKGCVMVAEGIKENVFLKEIDISMNGFGLEGANALGEAIKQNRTLLRLNASYCRLPDEGAAPIAAGLQVNETLQILNVGYNSMGHAGALTLIQGLEKNDCSGLTLLNLGNSRVSQDFKQLQDKLESERPLRVRHAGVMLETLHKEMDPDPWEAFKKDPMTKLKEWVEQAGYRLIDLFRLFDRDGSMSVSREEFIKGIKSTHIDITDEQIQILLDRLDENNDGEIEFGPWLENEGELVKGDNDHRSLKRDIIKVEGERRASMRDAETETEPEPKSSRRKPKS